MTRIIIEDYELDIDKELINRITYAIDDLEKLDTKATAFSKTIVIPGTTNNNNILGNIFEFNNANFTFDNEPNVTYNFNAARTAKCRIEVNGMQIIKGVFQLLEIVYNGGQVEYECSIRGELGGFMSKVGNLRLEDLDFSDYDQTWSNANIVASWSNANTGLNVYYPLVDIGLVSTGAFGTAKKDYQYRAFRPALHVREYLDKIITNAGYTWESDFCDTDFFKRLIIPHNAKDLITFGSSVYTAETTTVRVITGFLTTSVYFDTLSGSLFTTTDNKVFTYNGATPATVLFTFDFSVYYDLIGFSEVINLFYEKNGTPVYVTEKNAVPPGTWTLVAFTANISLSPGDTISFKFGSAVDYVSVTSFAFTASAGVGIATLLNLGDSIVMNTMIPKGVYQKDFFASILKMFYLLVTEDKFKERHLIITPWINFYDTDASTFIDWSDKIDRSKQIRVKPMSELNARFYELKYKGDTDFYSDGYKKLFNEGYGDRLFDNGYEFSKEKETVEVIFANAVLVGYAGEEKIVPTIFKRSNNIEERIDHVVRIMQAKKVTGVASWLIMNSGATLSTNTDYGYAGHLDDPDAPDADICFGVPKELSFVLVSGNLSNNLFNAYYSSYMAEITDKDSRLWTGMVKLNDTEIYNLDFSKFIYLDGGLYRLQKLDDYAAGENEPTKADLLRVIYTTY